MRKNTTKEVLLLLDSKTGISLYEFHQSIRIYQHYVLETDKLILNYNSNMGKIPGQVA